MSNEQGLFAQAWSGVQGGRFREGLRKRLNIHGTSEYPAQGDLVRTIPLGVGIALLLVGVIVIAVASQLSGQTDYQRVARVEDLPYGEWYVTAEFRARERFFVGFPMPNLEGVPDGEMVLYVNITDPTGGNTTLRIHERVGIVSEMPEFNVTVEATSSGLDAPQPLGNYNDGPIDFGGVAERDGLHTVHAYMYGQPYATLFYPPDGELSRLELYKEVSMTPPFVQYAVAGGGATSLIGVLLFVWAAKSQPPRPRRGKKRR